MYLKKKMYVLQLGAVTCKFRFGYSGSDLVWLC